MHTKRLLPVLSVLVAFAVFAPSASAATTTTTGCDGLQDALDNSGAGDTIVLSDNSYCFGHFDLPTHAITLRGDGSLGDNGFDGDGGDQILSGTDVGETTITNLVFQNGNTSNN